MVSLKVLTPAICQPITLDLLKSQLYLSTSLDDALLTTHIQAATDLIEAWTNRSFIKKEYQMTLAWLPLFDYRMQGYVQGTAPNPGWFNGLWTADSMKIKLYRANLIEGSSQIVYKDLNGNSQTLSETTPDYQVNPWSEPALILPLSGTFWPWTQYSNPTAVKITYEASCADETAVEALINGSPAVAEATARQSLVPGWAQMAILQLAAHFYEHREAVTDLRLTEIPLGVSNIIAPFVVEDFCPTKG